MIESTVPRLRYSIPEAAVALGVSEANVWMRIRQGHLMAVRDGRRTFITASVLEDYAREGVARS